jgi:hypothetical protein
MNYSLGNMLSRGGALNPDGLALDLQFAADKTLTARRGPTPTFTRASTATFVGSDGLIQSAAINAPRFDHDPVTLACKGLLIEESRTNLRTYSEDFSQATYGKTGVTISSVSDTSPSGGATIQKLLEDTSTGAHGFDFLNAQTGTQTFSIFLKAAGRQWGRLTANSVVTWFDLQNGVIGTVGAGQTALITNFGNGWYRCSVSFNAALSNTIQVRAATGDANLIYTGDGTSGIYAWGAQVEVGAFPTSYIPTTTASVVRSADVCSITGSDFTGFYNQSEGTFQGAYSFVSGYSNANNAMALFQASNNTYAEVIRVGTSSGSLTQKLDTVIGSSLTRITTSNNQSLTTLNKVAGAYKVGSNAISLNGAAVAAGSPASITSSVSRLDLGGIHDGASKINGHIAAIRYYKKRLPDAKLQSLTT